MFEVIILGSFGIDNIKTPFGEVKNEFGGSAPYASYGASFFSKVGLLSIKGEDISSDSLKFMTDRGISLEGLQSQGSTMKWGAEYGYDMNEAKTLNFEANSLNDFKVNIPDSYKNVKYLFIANFDPEKQIDVIKKMNSDFVLLDTHGWWIKNKKDKLMEAIKFSNVLMLNEWEARELFSTPNLVKAGKSALKLGLKAVIIKKGEHGSLLFYGDEIFSCPSYPLENVIDPTGCGDTFGGAFIGYYSKYKDMRKAIVYASVIASFNAEGFGISNLKKITIEDIEKRYKKMFDLIKF